MLTYMKSFLIQNWTSVVVLVGFLLYVVYLIANKKWEELRTLAYKIIREAEQSVTGSKKGREKFELVFSCLYSLVPRWLQFFISEASLRKKLQDWFNDVKDYLDDGKVTQS